jgi:hypothetical protein
VDAPCIGRRRSAFDFNLPILSQKRGAVDHAAPTFDPLCVESTIGELSSAIV